MRPAGALRERKISQRLEEESSCPVYLGVRGASGDGGHSEVAELEPEA